MKKTIARVVLGLVAVAYCILSLGAGWPMVGSFNALAADGGVFQSKDAASRAEDIQGELEVIVEDAKANWRTLYYLKTEGGKLALHLAKEQQNLQTGMKVRVRGVRNGNDLTADKIRNDVGGSFAPTAVQTTALALTNTTGEHKVAVILVNFKDASTQPYTVEQARSVAFGTTSDFFRENSYGQTWLSGDVFGWFTMPISSTVCDKSAISTYAQQAAVKAGANLAAYNHLVYVFPQIAACSFSGSSTIGGSPSEEWINTDSISLEVLGHELGHGFGLYHSHSMDCRPEVTGTNCSVTEYGDKFDIMGVSMPEHMNLFQKEQLGWVNYGSSPPLTTVTTSGTYWMDAYETIGSGAKGLKVLKSVDPTNGARTWYYLEHRTTYGFDSYLTGYTYVLGGVVVHTGSEESAESSYLLDMTPGTTSWYDSTLSAGQSYSDTSASVTIKTLSADSTGAWVQITVGSQPCTAAVPRVSISPGQSTWLIPGATYRYNIAVTNADVGGGCQPRSLGLHAGVPLGWSYNFAVPILDLAPGQSASTTIDVTSPDGAADGNYNVNSSAGDAMSTGSARVSYIIVSGLGVTNSSSSATYTQNQTAKITAAVWAAGAPVAGGAMSFTMTKSNGAIVTGLGTTDASGNAVFQYAFNRKKDPSGTYQVRTQASANGRVGINSVSFAVK